MPPSPIQSDTLTPTTPGPAPWPLTFVWLGDHWSRDWMQFWSGAEQIDNPIFAAETEGQAMASAVRDWWVAVGALWTFPMSIWLTAGPAIAKAAGKDPEP